MKELETLKRNQLIANLKKCEFDKESLIYLGHMIDGGELRVDPNNIVTIIQWYVLDIFTEVRIFMGVAQYLRKFIANLFIVVAPLHAMTTKGKKFQWGRP